jgi:hypothetical protein
MAQVFSRMVLVGIGYAGAACASSAPISFVGQADPQATVASFMNAVQANDFEAMGQLWGTEDGPAADHMDSEQLDMRLTVMTSYLAHEKYQVVEQPTAVTRERRRLYRVELTRQGCLLRVPFEVILTRRGWLVSKVDLEQAGNPGRPCPTP